MQCALFPRGKDGISSSQGRSAQYFGHKTVQLNLGYCYIKFPGSELTRKSGRIVTWFRK